MTSDIYLWHFYHGLPPRSTGVGQHSSPPLSILSQPCEIGWATDFFRDLSWDCSEIICSEIVKFADDTKLCRLVKTETVCWKLQKNISNCANGQNNGSKNKGYIWWWGGGDIRQGNYECPLKRTSGEIGLLLLWQACGLPGGHLIGQCGSRILFLCSYTSKPHPMRHHYSPQDRGNVIIFPFLSEWRKGVVVHDVYSQSVSLYHSGESLNCWRAFLCLSKELHQFITHVPLWATLEPFAAACNQLGCILCT